MKTLIALLLVTVGLGGAYWKLEHPEATVDDIKAGAVTTLDRAKSGFAAFRDGSELGGSATDNAAIASATSSAADPDADTTDTTLSAANAALASSDTELSASQQTLLDERVKGLETQLDNRLTTMESRIPAIDGTVVNGRLTDTERRLDASDQKLSQLIDDVGSLTDELDTVSSSLGNLNDNVASSVGQNGDYTTQLAAINQRLDELASEMADQDSEQTVTNIGTRIDSIDSRLTSLDTANSEALDEINASLASLTDQSSALQSRINTLSVAAIGGDDSEDGGSLNAQIDQRLQEMETKLATANADTVRLDSLVQRLNTANAQISALNAAQTDASDNDSRMANVLKELDLSTAKTAELEQRLDESSELIASLTQELSTLKNEVSSTSVEALQAELNEQLDLLKTRIENTDDSTDISTLNQSLATTRNRIQLLESRVQGLPSDGETAQAAQDAQTELQAQIAAMEERLRNLPQQTDPELLNTLNQVQAEVAELRDRGTQDVIEYKVYFGRSSTEISDDAAVVLKSFIKQEQNRTTGVNIYGFTDRRGDAAFNQRLALQRATAVRSFLIQNGFDYTKIKSLSGLGEDAAAVTLDDGAEDADQRAVVLVADQP